LSSFATRLREGRVTSGSMCWVEGGREKEAVGERVGEAPPLRERRAEERAVGEEGREGASEDVEAVAPAAVVVVEWERELGKESE
jgi:hypothetical protein